MQVLSFSPSPRPALHSASSAVMESAALIKYPNLNPSTLSFSQQQLVDCCNNGVGNCYESSGCNGGATNEGMGFASSIGQARVSPNFTSCQLLCLVC